MEPDDSLSHPYKPSDYHEPAESSLYLRILIRKNLF
jgi:hypothetical protein